METNANNFLKSNQAQLRLLDSEDILYTKNLIDVDIKSLIRPNYSSRKLVDNQINALVSMLKQFGFLGGIFVEASSHHVIDGWQRVVEWKKLGSETIPCFIINCTPKQERALHLGLNQQSSIFDPSLFDVEFKEFDLQQTFGIDPFELSFLNNPLQTKFSKPQKNAEKGFTKLSTLLPIAAYDQLKSIRKKMQVPSISDALVNLINLYDEIN